MHLYAFHMCNSKHLCIIRNLEFGVEMFEAYLASGSMLKKILESVKDLLRYAEFECSANGMKLQAMDASHTALVFLDLNSNGFDRYRCDRNFVMGVNLESMSKILKGVGDQDSVTLRVETLDVPDELNIIYESPDHSEKSDYTLRLMDLSTEPLEIPETEHICTIRLPSVRFLRICRDLSLIGEDIVITCAMGEVYFAIKGDIGKANIKLVERDRNGKEEEAVVINAQDSVTLTFSCRYLNYITKATALSSQVQLSLTPDLPLVVEYRIADIGVIRYYLAPKIEDE